jgi:hypothetical protein
MKISAIPTFQEEIDPCNVSLPESDDEGSCVVEFGEQEGRPLFLFTKRAMEVSGILSHQTEEIDPCNVCPESDDESSRIGNVVNPGGKDKGNISLVSSFDEDAHQTPSMANCSQQLAVEGRDEVSYATKIRHVRFQV